MKYAGLDLGGINSRGCVREDGAVEKIHESALPERASVVLLPLIRSEQVLAGDRALASERGLGWEWPPLAMTSSDGWACHTPPIDGGRVLLASVWHYLNRGGHWEESQWHPPDDLPSLTKRSPADCLGAEVDCVLEQMGCDPIETQIALSIPNQLPEESQDALLSRLPHGARLIWRSVAAAMAFAEKATPTKPLTVVDAGFHSIEMSTFEFRQKKTNGRQYSVPVRRLEQIHRVETGSILENGSPPFMRPSPDMDRMKNHINEVAKVVELAGDVMVVGPFGNTLVTLMSRAVPSRQWPAAAHDAVARGSSLFLWRLAKRLPTYLDVLPSLELFTLTEVHEPNWIQLIPSDCEVSGGEDYHRIHHKRVFIEKNTTRLASWLQRSGETDFRKVTTDLPVKAASNALTDLTVSARSAGGFARVRISPSSGEDEVFGVGQSILLNWQSMERIAREPQDKWPPQMVKYGWPKCGELFSHRPIFDEFLMAVDLYLDQATTHRLPVKRMGALGILKSLCAKTIAPRLAGVTGAAGDAAPLNQLLCFGSHSPCRFLMQGYAGDTRIEQVMDSKHRRAEEVARILWNRLKSLYDNPARSQAREINALTYILGRMAAYAPPAFQNSLARQILPVTKAVRLFAAGRALSQPSHGERIFATIKDKADFGQPLNNNWLRMLVYVLYQHPEILRDVPREHISTCAGLTVSTLEQKLRERNLRVLFTNCLRSIALLLRARRYAGNRDFLCSDSCPEDEAKTVIRIKNVLMQLEGMKVSRARKVLIDRIAEWLDYAASTDEMPPIAPPDEEDEEDEDGDD